jgi:predicted enzyme related to lactoylglutathione lyase
MKLHQVRERLDAQDADLSGSRFDDVNLQQAVFNNVNLREARFSDVNLTRVTIENANLSHMTILGVPVTELFAAWRSRTGAVLFAKDLAALSNFYQAVLAISASHSAEDHVVIASTKLRLLIHRLPADVASTVQIANPPRARSQTAIKLMFEVASIADARQYAQEHGGQLFPPESEWVDGDFRVCDGTDPEGNVVQFIERIGQ